VEKAASSEVAAIDAVGDSAGRVDCGVVTVEAVVGAALTLGVTE
jgi:hypothetical protein